jgi:outer membrane lipoprotein-sorting protein
VLNRPVTVVRYWPTGTSQTNDQPPLSSGEGRIWLDEELMLVLRHELDTGAGGELGHGEVTTLTVGQRPDASLLQFTPPPDATLME